MVVAIVPGDGGVAGGDGLVVVVKVVGASTGVNGLVLLVEVVEVVVDLTLSPLPSPPLSTPFAAVAVGGFDVADVEVVVVMVICVVDVAVEDVVVICIFGGSFGVQPVEKFFLNVIGVIEGRGGGRRRWVVLAHAQLLVDQLVVQQFDSFVTTTTTSATTTAAKSTATTATATGAAVAIEGASPATTAASGATACGCGHSGGRDRSVGAAPFEKWVFEGLFRGDAYIRVEV